MYSNQPWAVSSMDAGDEVIMWPYRCLYGYINIYVCWYCDADEKPLICCRKNTKKDDSRLYIYLCSFKFILQLVVVFKSIDIDVNKFAIFNIILMVLNQINRKEEKTKPSKTIFSNNKIYITSSSINVSFFFFSLIKQNQ